MFCTYDIRRVSFWNYRARWWNLVIGGMHWGRTSWGSPSWGHNDGWGLQQWGSCLGHRYVLNCACCSFHKADFHLSNRWLLDIPMFQKGSWDNSARRLNSNIEFPFGGSLVLRMVFFDCSPVLMCMPELEEGQEMGKTISGTDLMEVGFRAGVGSWTIFGGLILSPGVSRWLSNSAELRLASERAIWTCLSMFRVLGVETLWLAPSIVCRWIPSRGECCKVPGLMGEMAGVGAGSMKATKASGKLFSLFLLFSFCLLIMVSSVDAQYGALDLKTPKNT